MSLPNRTLDTVQGGRGFAQLSSTVGRDQNRPNSSPDVSPPPSTGSQTNVIYTPASTASNPPSDFDVTSNATGPPRSTYDSGKRVVLYSLSGPQETFYPFPPTDSAIPQLGQSFTFGIGTGPYCAGGSAHPSSTSSAVGAPFSLTKPDSNAADAPPSTAAVGSYHERIRAAVKQAKDYKTIQYPKAKLACSKLWEDFKREHMRNLGKGPKTGSSSEDYPAPENVFWTMLTYLVCENGADFQQQVRINDSEFNPQQSESRTRYRILLQRARAGIPVDNATLSAVLKILHDEEKGQSTDRRET